MKILSKKKLAMTVGALMGVAGMVPTANAVHFATDGLGDALMNYYTVNNGRATLINYTNTSDQTIAMRVRLHESNNSRPVDFTVILSPWDVWNATISHDGNGPVIYTADESCTIPHIGAGTAGDPATSLTVPFAAAGATGDSINEGYVAAIVMASKPGGHHSINCDAEEALFVNKKTGAYDALMGVYGQYTNNAIKGVYNILNLPLGQNAASGMTTLADFFAAGEASAPYADGKLPNYPTSAGGGSALKSLVSLQLDPDAIDKEVVIGQKTLTPEQRYLASFYVPSLASANTPAYVLLGDNWVGTTEDLSATQGGAGAAAVSYLFARTNVINMWTAFQGDWDTATDLVIQSFVKAYFVDDAAVEVAGRYQWRPGVPQSAILKPRGNTTPTAPFADRFGNFGLSCDPFNAVLYDREENIEVAEVVPTFSPVPNLNNELCFETNVITFNGSFALESPYSWDIQSESFLNGWIDVDLRGDANLYTITGTGGTAAASTVVPGEYYYGLPVDSFAFTTRVKGGGLNEAIIVPSAYKRAPDPITKGWVKTVLDKKDG
jgi:hypothetical protein